MNDEETLYALAVELEGNKEVYAEMCLWDEEFIDDGLEDYTWP